MVDAAIEAFAGTGKPYIHISGLWVYGANASITEESPINAPALVAWREPIERRVLDARDMRGVVIVSGVAYGDGGGGVPGVLLGSPRDDAGNLIMLGTGQQHWSTVHVADLADVFRRVLEDDSARGYYVVGDGVNPTVAELTEAAAAAVGAPGAVPGSDDEARARLGDYFAEVLLLDQGTDAAKARAELGWLRPIRDSSTSSATGATAAEQACSVTSVDPAMLDPRRPRTGWRSASSSTHTPTARIAAMPRGRSRSFTEDTHFVVYMDGEGTEPTQELSGREALTPVFADLNRYEATTHFNGQSTIALEGDRAPARATAWPTNCTPRTATAS